MLTSRTSRWGLGTALLCIVLLVATYMLLVGPRRSSAAQLDLDREAAEAQNVVLQQKVLELSEQFADLPQQREQLKAIQQQMPERVDIPALVRSLESIGDATGTSVLSVTPGAVAPYAAAGATAAPTPAPAAGATGGTPRLYTVPVAVQLNGEYTSVSLFLRRLQTQLDRAVLVTGVTAAAEDEQGGVGRVSRGPFTVTLATEVFAYTAGVPVVIETPAPAATPSAGATPAATPSPTGTAPAAPAS